MVTNRSSAELIGQWLFDEENLKFILDGKLGRFRSNCHKTSSEGNLFIGAYSNPTNWWNGMIDEVAVFDAVLAKEEINHIIIPGLENWQSVDLSGEMATRWTEIKLVNYNY